MNDELEINGVEETLETEITVGYKPTVPLDAMWSSGADMPQITLRRDIHFMSMHPIVMVALEYYKAGISGAEFTCVSQNDEVAAFVLAMVQKLWRECVPILQDGGYTYGWAAGEHVYREVDGKLAWSYVKDFHPIDAHILTNNYAPIGTRIKNTRTTRPLDLWFASNGIPAKAAWYAHKARFGQHYGQSQLLGAWRPWRRLAWRDGVEQVIDAAIYRGGYAGPVVKHPPEDMQTARQGIPGTQLDGASQPRRAASAVARQMIEWAKAGAGFTMSSACYPSTQGGKPKWELIWPTQVMDVMPLVEAARYIEDQIFYGVGVPPELIRASGTGSGYSGRNIPREAFLCAQQPVADTMLNMLVREIVRPLVMFNYGDVPFTISCNSLLQTQVMAKNPAQAQSGDHPKGPDGKFIPKGTQGPDSPSTTSPGAQ